MIHIGHCSLGDIFVIFLKAEFQNLGANLYKTFTKLFFMHIKSGSKTPGNLQKVRE